MKLFFGLLAFVVAFMPFASAQSSDPSAILANIPSCALKCMATIVATSTCDLFDTDCTCKNAELQTEIEKCVLDACTIMESLNAKNSSMTMCGAPVRSRQRKFLAINDVMGVISGLFVLQRFATKLALKQPLGLDDLFVGLSMALAIPCIAINSHGMVPNGMGLDIWTVTPDQITNFGLNFYIMTILYFMLQTFLKQALICFFLRIFPTKGVRRSLYATTVFNWLYGLIYIFLTIFQCRPINLFWTKWQHKEDYAGSCLNINYMTWSSGGFTIALDLWILSIPLSQLKKMNLDWKKKVGVGVMFSVGLFVTIVSILRLNATIKLRAQTGANNATWEYLEFDLWSTIEINIGIVCACLPTFRLLLVRTFPKLRGSSARKYYQQDGSGFQKVTPSGSASDSYPLGKVSQGDKTPYRSRVDPVGITCDRTYEVEFNQRDNDETQLFYMKDLDRDLASTNVGVKDKKSILKVFTKE